jgi:regulatory protein
MDEQLPAQGDDDRAVELAYRALGRRERTVAELRRYLEGKRVEPDLIDAAVERLCAEGWLDDARYASRFTEDKRTLERWGGERIARDLRKRGVEPDLIEAALGDREREEELRAAVEVLREKLPAPEDDRSRDRAWRLLVRRGYEPELAYEAVRAVRKAA